MHHCDDNEIEREEEKDDRSGGDAHAPGYDSELEYTDGEVGVDTHERESASVLRNSEAIGFDGGLSTPVRAPPNEILVPSTSAPPQSTPTVDSMADVHTAAATTSEDPLRLPENPEFDEGNDGQATVSIEVPTRDS